MTEIECSEYECEFSICKECTNSKIKMESRTCKSFVRYVYMR